MLFLDILNDEIILTDSQHSIPRLFSINFSSEQNNYSIGTADSSKILIVEGNKLFVKNEKNVDNQYVFRIRLNAESLKQEKNEFEIVYNKSSNSELFFNKQEKEIILDKQSLKFNIFIPVTFYFVHGQALMQTNQRKLIYNTRNSAKYF